MMGTRTILVVEDEAELRSMLVAELGSKPGLLVLQARTGAEAIEAVREGRPDLVLLDVGLPDMDGREVTSTLRATGYREPIVLLTGHTGETDVVSGFGCGATDFVEKPFTFGKLWARLSTHLERFQDTEDAEVRIGPFRFTPANRYLALSDGNRVRLTDKEAKILRFLHRARGTAVPRDKLLQDVWGYNANVSTHTVETHVYRLRQKLEGGASDSRFIVTDHNGYRLEAAAAFA